jgi:hypothetical protein
MAMRAPHCLVTAAVSWICRGEDHLERLKELLGLRPTFGCTDVWVDGWCSGQMAWVSDFDGRGGTMTTYLYPVILLRGYRIRSINRGWPAANSACGHQEINHGTGCCTSLKPILLRPSLQQWYAAGGKDGTPMPSLTTLQLLLGASPIS